MRRPLLLLSGVLLAGAMVAGCGGSDPGAGDTDATPAEPAPAAKAEDFPSAKGRTFADILANLPEGPALLPSVSVLDAGRDRVAFSLFDTARRQMSGAAVALYVARTDGSRARGPFPARSESLQVRPQFRSRQNAEDADAARSVYVADVPFKKTGPIAVVAIAQLDGRLVASKPYMMRVGVRTGQPPRVGEKAPLIHTETPADVSGELAKIDTRLPPLRNLHDVDAADVLGKKPMVLVFATPQLCKSRVCGPVVDVVAQVQSQTGSAVEFVHQEIFAGNDPHRGYRPQVAAYRLPSEPWTFVIDRDGRVAARFEGAFSVGELRRAVAKVR
jgi:hypothetical protein